MGGKDIAAIVTSAINAGNDVLRSIILVEMVINVDGDRGSFVRIIKSCTKSIGTHPDIRLGMHGA